jgi:hypothetical protein
MYSECHEDALVKALVLLRILQRNWSRNRGSHGDVKAVNISSQWPHHDTSVFSFNIDSKASFFLWMTQEYH